MKIIRVGRSHENDIVINDPYVGRSHCEFIQDDSDSYWVIDLNSKNGTYVNGTRCSGKIKLNKHDMVRVGNVVCPWEGYFNPINNSRIITIGRSSKNNLPVNDPKASRLHCRIECNDNGTMILEDMGSTNGTFVNGRRIGRRVPLRHGDVIKIGNTCVPWEKYLDDSGKMGTETGIGTEVGTGPSSIGGPNTGGGELGSEKASTIPLVIFFCGLAAFGLIVYIIVNYFTSFATRIGVAFGGEQALLTLFPHYLRGWYFTSGQLFPLIAAVVLGILTNIIDFMTGEKDNKLTSAGQWLGDVGASIGVAFIIWALVA